MTHSEEQFKEGISENSEIKLLKHLIDILNDNNQPQLDNDSKLAIKKEISSSSSSSSKSNRNVDPNEPNQDHHSQQGQRKLSKEPHLSREFHRKAE